MGPVSLAGSLSYSFIPVTHFTLHKHLTDIKMHQQRRPRRRLGSLTMAPGFTYY